MRCGFCGKEYGGSGQWHSPCAKKFFGISSVPEIGINSRTLEDFAKRNIEAGNTVTGVQKKLSLHLEKKAKNYRLTLVGHPVGFILKPPSSDYPELPEMEQTVMTLADIAGIRTVPHGLIQLISGEYAYITRRIDRLIPSRQHLPHRKIAMEDLCQLSLRLTEDKYRGSYEQCGKVIARCSSRPGLDMTEYFYLILFCFITGNSDMHLKNFSLIEEPNGWIFSPSYDLLSTQLLMPEDLEETALHLNGKKRRLKRSDFIEFGKNLGIMEKVILGLIAKLLKQSNHFYPAIDQSFLSAPSREQLKELITNRYSVLSFG